MKPSKQEANYRYPEACCGLCVYSYQNTLGDYQCHYLVAGNTIDIGGVCDAYRKEEVDEA